MAEVECCLKVHNNCDSCMGKTMEVLRAINGVYSVTWDAEQNIVRVSGEVDPNILLKSVMRAGVGHAELLNVNLRGGFNNNGFGMGFGYGHGNGHGHGYDHGYGHGYMPLPQRPDIRPLPYHELYNRLPTAGIQHMSPYDNNYNNNGRGYGYGYENPLPLPRATHVPSYPYQEHDPYANYDGLNICTIM